MNANFSSIPAVQVQSGGVLELDNGVTLTADVTNPARWCSAMASPPPTPRSRAITRRPAPVSWTSSSAAPAPAGTIPQRHRQCVPGRHTQCGLVNGFVPTAGDSFQIITYMGTLTGDFTTKNFPTLGNGNKFTTSSGSGSYQLSVTT